jgi:hypothetical protein
MSAASAMRLWIEREFRLDGVLAVVGGVDLGSGFAAIALGELVMANNDEVWRAIASGIVRLHPTGMPAGELLWGFEHAVLCTVLRDDGAWLGVFTVPKLNDQAALELRTKLDAFREQAFA